MQVILTTLLCCQGFRVTFTFYSNSKKYIGAPSQTQLPQLPVAPESEGHVWGFSCIEIWGQMGWMASPACPLKPTHGCSLIISFLQLHLLPQQPCDHTSVSKGQYWFPGAELHALCAVRQKSLPGCVQHLTLHPQGSLGGWVLQVKTQLLLQSGTWKELYFLSRERKSQANTETETLPIQQALINDHNVFL